MSARRTPTIVARHARRACRRPRWLTERTTRRGPRPSTDCRAGAIGANIAGPISAGPQGYIYASPALGAPRGVGPTVYIGSHDERFYALDAGTGRVRWSKRAGGRISGTAAVIGDIVDFSAYHGKRLTYGVRARDGREVFRRRKRAFDPAIADNRRLYLVGYSAITALEPHEDRGRRGGRSR